MLKRMKKKTWIFVLIAVFAALVTCWVFIHRRVIRACIKKEPLPPCPDWHPDCVKAMCAPAEE